MDRYGINKVMEMTLERIDPKNERDFHISFDIDALDRLEAPSTVIPRKKMIFFSIIEIVWKKIKIYFSARRIDGT